MDALARLTIPYSHDTPIITLALKGPGGTTAIAGVVDSGADKTLLPKRFAAKLGIPDEHLEPTEGSDGAGDAWFPTWEIPYPIEARIVVPFAQPRGPELWGPPIALTPEFATETLPLFGRADFFEVFTVTIDQPGGQLFHLDHSS
jgi:hypothetical protein